LHTNTGYLKTYTVEPGQSVSLAVTVTDGDDKYAVVLRDLEQAGVLGDGLNRLAFTPDSTWVNYSTLSPPYYASTSSKHEWTGGVRQFTIELRVDGSTPADFYALRFEVAGKGGGKWVQEEGFYLHVLPGEPLPGNGDIDGDGDVDMSDFPLLAANWLTTGCSPENDYCGGSDIDLNGTVDVNDLLRLTSNWLMGQGPADTMTGEDFETGDFSGFPWMNNIDAGWRVTSSEKHVDLFSAQSTPISASEQALWS
jgi:hypothetical protein